MTADGWHSIGGSACKQHTATTALVLWNYNIALEPKCMLLEVTPYALAQVSCVSSVFQGFWMAYIICLEIFEWCYCEKNKTEENMGNVDCV